MGILLAKRLLESWHYATFGVQLHAVQLHVPGALHSILFPERVFDKLADNELKVVIRLGVAFQFSVRGGAVPRGCLALRVQYKCSNKENQPC